MGVVVNCLSRKIPSRVDYLPLIRGYHFPGLDVDSVGQLCILGTTGLLRAAG